MGGHRTSELAPAFLLIPLETNYFDLAVVGGWAILQAETCQILSLAEKPRWSPSVAIFHKTSEVLFPTKNLPLISG